MAELGEADRAAKVWLCGGLLDLSLSTTTDQVPVEVRKAIDGEIFQRGYVSKDVLWFLAVSKYHATGWLKQ